MTTQSVLAAGIDAGKVWAFSVGDDSFIDEAPHKLKIARLRSWCSQLIADGNWDYRSVYACMFSNKLTVDNIGKAGDDELVSAIEDAAYEALDFWRNVPGWPDDENEWWTFVEGFVRGIAAPPYYHHNNT